MNVSGFVLASSVNAGGAERLVELGILVSMVNVFCAAQRMVAQMDSKHLGNDEREQEREGNTSHLLDPHIATGSRNLRGTNIVVSIGGVAEYLPV